MSKQEWVECKICGEVLPAEDLCSLREHLSTKHPKSFRTTPFMVYDQFNFIEE
jgi:hypothetical protein